MENRSDDKKDFDVAVVGAGPMGSFAAEHMARGGLKVALFEKDARSGDSTVCAGGMHYDLIEYLRLPADMLEKILPAFRYIADGRESEWRFEKPTYVTVERRNLDIFMADRAVQAGVELYTNARVVKVAPEQQTLYYVSGADGSEQQSRARIFVFADGPNSLVRRALIPPHRNRSGPQFVGLEYDLEAPANNLDALEIIPDPETLAFGYMWVFPKRDHVNVGLARLASMEGPNLRHLLDDFIAQRPELRGLKRLRTKGGVIPATIGPALQKDNWLAIGDAAGMVNPLTGGGYVCGFVSAALAARTCVEAYESGRFNVKILRKYSLRLRLTKHYVTIRLLHYLLSTVRFAYRVSKKPYWMPMLKVYFYSVHVAMRFSRVI